MKVLVINGSPTGKNSITLHTVLYIEKLYPECSFETLEAGQKIKSMEKDFSDCSKKLEEADLILFCYPVYTFLVPSQLHRFIELIKEQGVDLKGKFVTQISTSLHFYDTTAHRFIQENCADLGMKYIRGLSADMEDLLKEQGRKEARDFFRFVLWSMENDCYEPDVRICRTASPQMVEKPEVLESLPEGNRKIALVTDLSHDASGRLRKMIDAFCAVMPAQVEVANLQEFPFMGGCLGCFHCASSGECIYKDGFSNYLREKIQTADATVYAFTIKDHSMGYLFKLFDDRQFCNGHRTVTMGKPVGYLVDGDYSSEYNLQTLIEARAQVGGNYLAGVAVNGEGIGRLAKTLTFALDEDYQPPKNFYGVGGLKIFRDLIYQMKGLMKEDHRFYKQHGFYDFPQKRKGRIAGMYLVGMMMNNKKLSKKMGGKMTEGMIMPYQKVLKEAEHR